MVKQTYYPRWSYRARREAKKTDKPIAEKYPCTRCGAPRRYEADFRNGGYRAFAVCTVCGHEEEF